MASELDRWVEEQRGVARALGLGVGEWALALERAGSRRTELLAAVIGAAAARGAGLGLVAGLDGAKLGARARALLDPSPPRVRHPVLAEAVRRSDELTDGQGAQRLRKKSAEPSTPRRGSGSALPSVRLSTSDAPGDEG